MAASVFDWRLLKRPYRTYDLKWRIPNFRDVATKSCETRSPSHSGFRVGDLWYLVYRTEEIDRNGQRQKFVSLHLFLDRLQMLESLNIKASYMMRIRRADDKPWPEHHLPFENNTFQSRMQGFGSKSVVPLNDILNDTFITEDGSLYVHCYIVALDVEMKI